jgi:hypothetical protein
MMMVQIPRSILSKIAFSDSDLILCIVLGGKATCIFKEIMFELLCIVAAIWDVVESFSHLFYFCVAVYYMRCSVP